MSTRNLLITALAACLAFAPLVASADDSDAEAKRLSDRSVPRYEVSVPGASIKAGGAMVLVNAPIATVRKAVQDYGRYQSMIPRFKKSRVIAKKDGKTDVYLEVPILHGAATVWSQTRFDAPVKDGAKGERIEGRLVEGNVEDMRTTFRLRAVDDTHTILKCELLIVPKLPLPGSMVTPELAFAADQAVTALRARAERRAAGDQGTAKAD
ncbi:MAG: hypothetical protein IT374_20965 [Polyangiaceae bacterium]|nr:hypothetical protein [Polyangiaceae bacterium]